MIVSMIEPTSQAGEDVIERHIAGQHVGSVEGVPHPGMTQRSLAPT